MCPRNHPSENSRMKWMPKFLNKQNLLPQIYINTECLIEKGLVVNILQLSILSNYSASLEKGTSGYQSLEIIPRKTITNPNRTLLYTYLVLLTIWVT